MKKLKKVIGIGLGAICAVVPLAGNAYYCNSCLAEGEHVSKDIKTESDIVESMNIRAKSCVLMDKKSGKIILQKNAKQKLPMASMTKMMTMLLLLEEVEKGNINLNQTTIISEYSASQEGSECFLDANKPYVVSELLKSVAVASANDSSVAIAELVSGSEEIFVQKMNKRAKELGMANTVYKNSTGLDESGHFSTAEDMTKVIRELSKFDIIKSFSKVWMYDMEHSGGRVTNLTNTNRLIKTNPSVVLAKTGHTDNAGFCITAMAEKNGMELIACVMGEQTSEERFNSANKLLNFGFSNYESRTIVDKDQAVGKIKVRGGKEAEIIVYPAEDLAVLTIKGEEVNHNISLSLPSEVSAPLDDGEVVGNMEIKVNEQSYNLPIVTQNGVQEKTYFDIVKELL